MEEEEEEEDESESPARWLVDWTDSLRRSLVRSTGGEPRLLEREEEEEALKATEKERSLSGQRDAAAVDRDAMYTLCAHRILLKIKVLTTMSFLPTVF